MKKPMYEIEYTSDGAYVGCKEVFDESVTEEEKQEFYKYQDSKRKRINLIGWLCDIILVIAIFIVGYGKLNAGDYGTALNKHTVEEIQGIGRFTWFVVFMGISAVSVIITRFICNKVLNHKED